MLAFMIMRDRVTYARKCLEGLGAAGLDTVIVDHNSTWEEAVYWVADLAGVWGFDVWREFRNYHPRDLWRPGGPIDTMVRPGERYIVTDCDVALDSGCPANWPQLLGALLDERPAAVKAGLGLRTDDLPDHYVGKAQVQAWESQFQPPVGKPVDARSEVPAVWADIDTTLAMYRWQSGPSPFRLGPAIRTAAPYLARHLPWYEDSANPTPELAFYAAHAEHGHWRRPDGYADTHGLDGP